MNTFNSDYTLNIDPSKSYDNIIEASQEANSMLHEHKQYTSVKVLRRSMDASDGKEVTSTMKIVRRQ